MRKVERAKEEWKHTTKVGKNGNTETLLGVYVSKQPSWPLSNCSHTVRGWLGASANLEFRRMRPRWSKGFKLRN